MSERAVAAVQRIEYNSNRISQLVAGDPAMMQINPIQASNKKPGRSLSHARTEADGREGENEADQPNDGRWCHDGSLLRMIRADGALQTITMRLPVILGVWPL